MGVHVGPVSTHTDRPACLLLGGWRRCAFHALLFLLLQQQQYFCTLGRRSYRFTHLKLLPLLVCLFVCLFDEEEEEAAADADRVN